MQPGDPPFKLREIWPPGTVIKGDYIVERRLGGGGFGTVYLAQHRFLGTTHVIKRLHEQFASDAEYVNKFIREGRAVRRLKGCPHVVEVEHMTQSEDGHLILVMEHVSGGDLDSLMSSRQLSVAEVIEFSRQIAVALQAAHESKLIHRDIKPQNVMMSQDAQGKPLLKLIDFGIAADHLSTQNTSMLRGGSLGFAAPEQWALSGKELDGRCDLYALGATMYKMLTGSLPYSDVRDIAVWIVRAQKAPPAPSQLRRDVPAILSALILELLAFAPESRPASASIVAARLAAMQVTEPVPQRSRETTAPPSPPRPVSSATWKPVVIGATLAIAVAGAVVWLIPILQNKQSEPVSKPPVEEPVRVQPAKTIAQPPPLEIPQTKAKSEPAATMLQKPVEKKSATPSKPPTQTQPEPPKPTVDYLALGDKARDAGDYRTALQNYRALDDTARLATLQRSVEGDAEDRAGALTDKGQYAQAIVLADAWLREFPSSRRLQQLRAKIVRARDSQ